MSAERPQEGRLDWLFEPEWAGGWAATRILWVFAAALCLLPRARGIGDAYGASDMVFNASLYRLATVFPMDAQMAWGFYAVGIIGLVLVAVGRQAFYPGMLLWFVGNWALLAHEAVNVKAYDRLLTWIALALLFSPASQGDLTRKWRSPFARYLLLIVFIAAYGSTGLLKLTHEPGWLTGEVLAYHLLEPYHGSLPLGIEVSKHLWLTAPMSWFTLLFECGFPFLVWVKRANPVLLAMGFCFHLGLLVLMDVGPFFFVAISAYPALLHPELARELWETLQRRRHARARAANSRAA